MNWFDNKLKNLDILIRIFIKSILITILGLLMTYVYDFFSYILILNEPSFRSFCLFLITLFMWGGTSIFIGFKEIKGN